MKKLISLLAALGLGATGTASVVSCGDTSDADGTAFDLAGESVKKTDLAVDDNKNQTIIDSFAKANELTDDQSKELRIKDKANNTDDSTAKITTIDDAKTVKGEVYVSYKVSESTVTDLTKATADLGKIDKSKAEDADVITAFVKVNKLTDDQKAELSVSDNDGKTKATVSAKTNAKLVSGKIAVTYTIADAPAPADVKLVIDGKSFTAADDNKTATYVLDAADITALKFTADKDDVSSIFKIKLDDSEKTTTSKVAYKKDSKTVTITFSAAIAKDATGSIAAVEGSYQAAAFKIPVHK